MIIGVAAIVANAVVTRSLPFVHMPWTAALWWYGVACTPAWLYGYVYWRRTPRVSFVRALLYGHVFTLYGYLWLPAGWMALHRMLSRQGTWAKTARTTDEAPAPYAALRRLARRGRVATAMCTPHAAAMPARRRPWTSPHAGCMRSASRWFSSTWTTSTWARSAPRAWTRR
jgi:hypothetical protein